MKRITLGFNRLTISAVHETPAAKWPRRRGSAAPQSAPPARPATASHSKIPHAHPADRLEGRRDAPPPARQGQAPPAAYGPCRPPRSRNSPPSPRGGPPFSPCAKAEHHVRPRRQVQRQPAGMKARQDQGLYRKHHPAALPATPAGRPRPRAWPPGCAKDRPDGSSAAPACPAPAVQCPRSRRMPLCAPVSACKGVLPITTITSGSTSAICRSTKGRIIAISSGAGSRLPGGRHGHDIGDVERALQDPGSPALQADRGKHPVQKLPRRARQRAAPRDPRRAPAPRPGSAPARRGCRRQRQGCARPASARNARRHAIASRSASRLARPLAPSAAPPTTGSSPSAGRPPAQPMPARHRQAAGATGFAASAAA